MENSYYAHHVFVCLNKRGDGGQCCANYNTETIRAYAKEKLKALGEHGPNKNRVNMAGCLGRCAHGPVMVVYPEGVWYTFIDEEDVDEIIHEHLIGGRVVERLRLPDQAGG